MTATRVSGRGGVYIQGIVCGLLAAVLPGVALLLGILLLPAIGAAVTARDRDATRPMLLLAGATSILPLRSLWEAGLSISAALDLCQPATIGLSWSATAAAWLGMETCGVVSTQISQAARRLQRTRLQAERAALEAEWGRLDQGVQPDFG